MNTLHRDRRTWRSYSQAAVMGYFVYGFGPSIPLLRREESLSLGVAALHSTGLAAGTLVAGTAFAPVVARLGRRVAVWLGVAGLCVATVAYCLGPMLAVTLAAAAVAGFCGSFIVNGTASDLTAHHGPHGPAAVTEANAVAAGMGLLAPLAITVATALGLGWRVALSAVVPMAVLVWLRTASVPALGDDGRRAVSRQDRASLPRPYWVAWTMLVLVASVEFCLTIWSSELLAERTGLARGTSAVSVAAIVTGMFVGRLFGARPAIRFETRRLLLAAFAVTGVGVVTFVASRTVALSLVALVVAGLGMAVQFPLGLSRAIAAGGDQADLAAGRAGLATGTAIGLAPFALGALADQVGTEAAFWVVPCLLVIAALLVAAPAPAERGALRH